MFDLSKFKDKPIVVDYFDKPINKYRKVVIQGKTLDKMIKTNENIVVMDKKYFFFTELEKEYNAYFMEDGEVKIIKFKNKIYYSIEDYSEAGFTKESYVFWELSLLSSEARTSDQCDGIESIYITFEIKSAEKIKIPERLKITVKKDNDNINIEGVIFKFLGKLQDIVYYERIEDKKIFAVIINHVFLITNDSDLELIECSKDLKINL